jgi:hypothetical protein
MTLSDAVVQRLQELGLQQEPFAPAKENVYARTSVADPVQVDGFGTLANIDEHLQARIAANQTPLIAIVGQTGTGRSLAAKYVIDRWLALRNLDSARLAIPEISTLHFDDHDIFRRWMSLLRELAWDLNIPIPAAVDAALDAAVNASNRATYPMTFRRHATAYAQFMHPANASYAFCLEEVPSDMYLESAKIAFAVAGILCVCTIKDASGIDPTQHGWMTIRLTSLTGEETTRFISDFWQKRSASALPFDRDVLRTAFANRTETIAKIRGLMSRVLIRRLESKPDAVWDADTFQEALERAEAGGE